MNIQLVNNFSNFDYAISIIIFLSCLFAFAKGFIKTSISFLGWLIIFSLSTSCYPLALKLLHAHIANEHALQIAAGIAAFMLSVILVSLVSNKLLALSSGISGGLIDRSLGLIFGLMRGCIFSCIIFWSITAASVYMNNPLEVNEHDPDYANKILPSFLKHSQSFHLVRNTSSYLGSFLPPNIRRTIYAVISPNKMGVENYDLNPANKNTSKTQATADPAVSVEQRNAIQDLIKALPENVVSSIDSNNLNNFANNTLSDAERTATLNQLLNLYDQAVKSDEVAAENLLTTDEQKTLHDLLINFESQGLEALDEMKNIEREIEKQDHKPARKF